MGVVPLGPREAELLQGRGGAMQGGAWREVRLGRAG